MLFLLFHFQAWGFIQLTNLTLVFAFALPFSLYASHAWKFGIPANLLIAYMINLTLHLVIDQNAQPFYQYLAEFILLSLVVIPSTVCGRQLRDFIAEYKLVSSLFADQNIPRLDDVRSLIESEFARGSRYNYPISLVLLRSKPDTSSTRQQQAEYLADLFREHLAGNELSTFLYEKSRITDILVRSEIDNEYLLICPGTDRQSAELLIDRLKNVQSNRQMVDFQSSIAAFPDDARSFNSLIEHLRTAH